LVLLDDGWSCEEVAAAFLLNDDTIRDWHKLFEQRGIEGHPSASTCARRCGAQCPRTARQWASSSRLSPSDSAFAV
jgi:hypothetical protein